MNLLKRLTYHRGVRRAARWLGLDQILVPLYYLLAGPKGKVLRLEIGGIDGSFHVHTPQELRMLESLGGEGSEEHILELFVNFLKPGDVVYDIGSNVGLYTVILAKAVGDDGWMIAFEPEPRFHDHLAQNVRLNGLTNVRCFNKALGDSSGEARFNLGSFSLARPSQGSELGRQEVVVEVVEGDQLVASEHLPRPRAVKIDVEGHEYAVLKGLSETLGDTSCELVCCEIHPSLLPPNIKPEMVLDLLTSFGFGRIDVHSRRATYHAMCYRDFGIQEYAGAASSTTQVELAEDP